MPLAVNERTKYTRNPGAVEPEGCASVDAGTTTPHRVSLVDVEPVSMLLEHESPIVVSTTGRSAGFGTSVGNVVTSRCATLVNTGVQIGAPPAVGRSQRNPVSAVHVVVEQPRLGARHAGGDPFAMGERHETVLPPVQDQDGGRDLAQLEIPAFENRNAVVPPAVGPTFGDRLLTWTGART